VNLFGKSLKQWRKDFDKSGKWTDFEVVSNTLSGWIVRVKAANTCLIMELGRNGKASMLSVCDPDD
jgi:hypothetical protein